MSNSISRLTTAFAAVPMLFLVHSAHSQSAQDEPEAVKRFKKTIDAEAKLILKVAHFLGQYKDHSCDGYKEVRPKHELTYTWRWIGTEEKKKAEFRTKLAFLFTLDKNDRIKELEIAVKEDTSPFEPFRGTNFVTGPFRVQVRLLASALSDDKAFLESINKMKGDGLLAVWLKFRDRKAKK